MRNFIYKQDLTTSNDQKLLKTPDDEYSENHYLDTQDKDTDDFNQPLINFKSSFP